MFRKPAYTPEELSQFTQRLEILDRLVEKAKRNYLGGGQLEADKAVYESYTKTLLVANETYQRMLQKTAK